MIPEHLSGFFIAGSGAAAALAGLLFVAIAISPERVFGAPSAPQAIATSALLALLDAFFVSCGALVSATSLAWIGVGAGVLALVGTLALSYTLLYQELNPRLVRRRSVLVAASFVVYLLQCWYAAQLLIAPPSPTPAYALAYVLLAVFGIGILRAYELLGARVTGLREWLGPRHYTEDKRPLASPGRRDADVHVDDRPRARGGADT
jgi:hypothetical protein